MMSFDSWCDFLITTCFWLFYFVLFMFCFVHFDSTRSSVRVHLIMVCVQTMSQQQANKVSSNILSSYINTCCEKELVAGKSVLF